MNFFKNHTHVTLTADDAGIATMQMIDAKGKNGLTPHFIEELIACITEVKNNETFKVLIMAGTTDVFNSGADLDTLVKLFK